jgi:hypothetical protein
MLSTAQGMPPAYRAALASLQDAAPPRPFAAVDAVLRAELGAPAATLFASFEPQAAAAASLAQARRARACCEQRAACAGLARRRSMCVARAWRVRRSHDLLARHVSPQVHRARTHDGRDVAVKARCCAPPHSLRGVGSALTCACHSVS